MEKRKYDSTVARIAGNLLSGHPDTLRFSGDSKARERMADEAVLLARAIVAATIRTEPEEPR